jgi:hypothetical protein
LEVAYFDAGEWEGEPTEAEEAKYAAAEKAYHDF